MKGIILAGGSGTRLYPITKVVCKQLLPVYDKPMIYYSLATLMLTGIRDILIISTPEDTSKIVDLLGDGNDLGIQITYKIQQVPNGIAQAFVLGKEFIGTDSVCLILGDNVFYGNRLMEVLENASLQKEGATVFGYYVNDPERYGVVEFDKDNNVLSIEEKPKKPKSNYAVVGLYFYDNNVVSIAENIKPSARGEYEITDVNKEYLKQGNLKVELLGRGYAWLDTGTHDSLTEATNFIKTIEDRQGLKIACIEEIAYTMDYIDKKQLLELAEPLLKSGYGQYLVNLIAREL